MPLKVVIVGGGLAGLATALALSLDGHDISVLESTRDFTEVRLNLKEKNCVKSYAQVAELTSSQQIGAGIHVPPNATRLLTRWGVDLERIGNPVYFYRYKGYQFGERIASVDMDDPVKQFGAEYYFVHRAELHQALLDAVLEAGVTVYCDQRVALYDDSGPRVVTQRGEMVSGDLIIAADGIKSTLRTQLTCLPASYPRLIGDIAYRFTIPRDVINAEAMLRVVTRGNCMSTWIGPKAHVVGYPICDGELYNVVICESTGITGLSIEEQWAPGERSKLRKRFAGWDARIDKLIQHGTDIKKWNLCDLDPLQGWVSPSGRACLLGDSCHAMLPYLAQGAAQAIEDAATLRMCLKEADREAVIDIPSALRRYEAIRKPRTTNITMAARETRDMWHLEAPDRIEWRNIAAAKKGPGNPVYWLDDDRKAWLFGHDAEWLAKSGDNWRENPHRGPSITFADSESELGDWHEVLKEDEDYDMVET